IHADTSQRIATPAAPHKTVLRATLAAFAAATGGADSMTVRAEGMAPDAETARAVARGIQHLLLHESRLAEADDPAAGSGALEALTDTLVGQGWAAFQAIEDSGSLIDRPAAGAIPDFVKAPWQPAHGRARPHRP